MPDNKQYVNSSVGLQYISIELS